MEAGPTLARLGRVRHRHELRTLTYVTLDQANGGIVRNLTHDGIGVQVVAAVRPRQQLRLRFELRYPRLQVETRGEVVWSTFSGQCGIRFLNPPPALVRQIDEWIFGDLLQGLSIPTEPAGLLTPAPLKPAPLPASPPSAVTARVLREFEKVASANLPITIGAAEAKDAELEEEAQLEQEDGLVVSPAKVRVIELRPPEQPALRTTARASAPAMSALPARSFPARGLSGRAVAANATPASERVDLDWLSQPLTGRSLAWTVDTLVVTAAVLLFALVFLSITREAPKWPLVMSTVGAIMIGGLYWGFFKLFGGMSLGERLSRLSDVESAEERNAAGRFR